MKKSDRTFARMSVVGGWGLHYYCAIGCRQFRLFNTTSRQWQGQSSGMPCMTDNFRINGFHDINRSSGFHKKIMIQVHGEKLYRIDELPRFLRSSELTGRQRRRIDKVQTVIAEDRTWRSSSWHGHHDGMILQAGRQR